MKLSAPIDKAHLSSLRAPLASLSLPPQLVFSQSALFICLWKPSLPRRLRVCSDIAQRWARSREPQSPLAIPKNKIRRNNVTLNSLTELCGVCLTYLTRLDTSQRPL